MDNATVEIILMDQSTILLLVIIAAVWLFIFLAFLYVGIRARLEPPNPMEKEFTIYERD
jgi:hypothetical protein